MWVGIVGVVMHIVFYLYVIWDYKVFNQTIAAAAAAAAAAPAATTPRQSSDRRVTSTREQIKAAAATLKTGIVRQSTLTKANTGLNVDQMDKRASVSAGTAIAFVTSAIARRERRQMTARQRLCINFVLFPMFATLLVCTALSGTTSSPASGPASVIVSAAFCVSLLAGAAFVTQTEFVEATGAELKAIKYLKRHPPRAFAVDPGTVRSSLLPCFCALI